MTKWMERAACKDQSQTVFYSESEDYSTNILNQAQAKSICRKCPVAAECLAYAIENKEAFGIWGSFAPRERKTIVNLFSNHKIDTNFCKSIVNKEIKSIKARALRNDLGV